MSATLVSAEPADNTVRIAARAALFLKPVPSGRIIAAIVYEPGDSSSEQEARNIERAIGSGVVVGPLTLKPRMVASNALGQLAGAKLAFVTRGTNYRAIAAAAAPRSILTIGSDPACALAAHCVMAIDSKARVQIMVSQAASRAARLEFKSSFLMLIKEI